MLDPELVVLEAIGAEAVVAPTIGACCLAFRSAEREVLERPPSLGALAERPSGYGCPILFPFPGQLEPSRYRFDGEQHDLSPNVPGRNRHSHGFAPARPWQLVERTPASCVCELDRACLTPEQAEAYPWSFLVTVRWILRPEMLRAEAAVENRGDVDMPFGFGLHPYFVVERDATIDLPAAAAWPHRGGIPTGRPAPTRGPWRWTDLTEADSTLLTDLPAGPVEARVGTTTIRFPGDRFGEVVLYRPPERPSVCLEPWTSVTSAGSFLEAGAPHGLVRLRPGERWNGWMEISSPPASPDRPRS